MRLRSFMLLPTITAMSTMPALAIAQKTHTATLSMSVNPDSTPDSSRVTSVGISPDSLAALRTFARTKHPVIVINQTVTTLKVFNAVKAATVASVQLQHGDREINYYGDRAKNGVLIITTQKAGTARANTSGDGTNAQVDMNFQMGGRGGKIIMKAQ